jgi:hypothetical protein
MKRRSPILALAFSFIALGASLASCRQGEGDRCQINEDCDDGLICGSSGGSGGTLTCREATPLTRDAAIDAPVVDAGGLDAL